MKLKKFFFKNKTNIDFDQRMTENQLKDILPQPVNPDAPKDTTGYTNFSYENQSILREL